MSSGCKLNACKIIVAVAGAMLLLLPGCGAKKFSSQTVEPRKWADVILKDAKFSDQLTELAPTAALKRYSVEKSDVENSAVYVGTGATAEEFGVWKMKDAAAADVLEKNAQKLLAAQKNSYADYNPAEVPKLQNAVIEKQGNVVVVCVSSNDAGAKTVVDGLFSGQ